MQPVLIHNAGTWIYALKMSDSRSVVWGETLQQLAFSAKTVSLLLMSGIPLLSFRNMKDYTMPCGNCRQFILEFGPDIVVYAVGNSGQILAKRADELLPFAFTGGDLPAK
ncbi:unnamed protein product [Ixodes pacificus]